MLIFYMFQSLQFVTEQKTHWYAHSVGRQPLWLHFSAVYYSSLCGAEASQIFGLSLHVHWCCPSSTHIWGYTGEILWM